MRNYLESAPPFLICQVRGSIRCVVCGRTQTKRTTRFQVTCGDFFCKREYQKVRDSRNRSKRRKCQLESD